MVPDERGRVRKVETVFSRNHRLYGNDTYSPNTHWNLDILDKLFVRPPSPLYVQVTFLSIFGEESHKKKSKYLLMPRDPASSTDEWDLKRDFWERQPSFHSLPNSSTRRTHTSSSTSYHSKPKFSAFRKSSGVDLSPVNIIGQP